MPRPSTGLNTVVRRRADGTVETRWYHRKTGTFIGASMDGWTKEQAIERARALEDDRAPAGPPVGSFGELCVLYLSSPAFRRLAPKTRKGYGEHIEALRQVWEAVPLVGINRKAVRALHGQYEDRPWQGNAILRTLRLVLNFGIDHLELPGLTKNPAAKVELYDTAPRSQVWDQAKIDAFLAHAHPRLRLAFALLLYTVQRPGDMLTMARPMLTERDGRPWIKLRQAKTGELVDVPCHQALARELAAAEAADKAAGEAAALAASRAGRAEVRSLARSALLVPSPKGKPWAFRNFARAWDDTRRRTDWTLARAAIRAMGGLPRPAKAREEAKAAIRARQLVGTQRRDLRRTGVVQLAEAGATVPQIAALAGWRIDYAQGIVDTYLPRRSEVALGGVERWESGERTVAVLPHNRLARS